MKNSEYRDFKNYGSTLHYKEEHYGSDPRFKDTIWGRGFYRDNLGNAASIYCVKNHPTQPDHTNIDFVYNGRLFEVNHFRTYSNRGLMLACSNLINKTLSNA